jgi:hypothetical protein
MGISSDGGYLQTGGFPGEAKIEGDYLPDRRELVIRAIGRTVAAEEMLCARSIQARQALGPGRPIERVVFRFADEAEARQHLHALWLRGLECDTFVGGAPVRLTDDYQPPPTAN